LPKYKYYILGDGPHRAYLKQLAAELGLKNKVVFRGAIAPDQIGAFYHFADLFVMLSITALPEFESFGLVYVEAGISGIPSIASSLAGAKEAVLHEKTGMVVDPHDSKSIKKAIIDLVQDPARRKRYAQAAKERALAELLPSTFVDRLLANVK